MGHRATPVAGILSVEERFHGIVNGLFRGNIKPGYLKIIAGGHPVEGKTSPGHYDFAGRARQGAIRLVHA
jgi:hypothetical protein